MSFSAIIFAEIQYQSLNKKFRPPRFDPYHYAMMIDQLIESSQTRSEKLYSSGNYKFSMQNSIFAPIREPNRSTQTKTETNFEVTLKFVILNRHPIPTSTEC